MATRSIGFATLRRTVITAITAMALFASFASAATVDGNTVYKVKAGFLYNFAKFTTWPPEHLQSSNTLTIGVAGPRQAFEVIAATLRGKMYNNRPIEVIHVTSPETTHTLEILYFAGTSEKELAGLLKTEASENILTISDTPDFAHRDGVIAFFERDGKIRFRVNPSNAKRAGLKLNSQLATLAEVVGS